ncbi:tRNA (adenosine(37)-N6)-dimethylallyltransferase MiaA [Erythrobacter sp. QSSC1-22B]|uniref:tRNA (adenosine(37)-N6)-dimethylallyltransferase MiaA n=1 Tax=Erythrobacter sp. QSSC1-22B TaxID=1860125 RepID=UPI000805E3AD|nr:tRNA (adenosine(37)-N6)-dimethylallyltransferase MiaA [Erythrobacter sp. QSSC1-22B]OBX18330.1 tRNA (adenosine(37)-N6)-dimethylallyltransferase MiaA [Erythrobacter sp. QSSC1-22B]
MSTRKTPEKQPSNPPVALIAGPTASGKSDLAVRLAQEIEADGRRAVVINCDSAQVYADLGVLSARPTPAEMGGIEHRLFGTWDGAVPCSAADWAAAAKREIAQLHAAAAVPVLCGGTGLYMRTLIDGIAPVPDIDPATRSAVRALSPQDARAALEHEDPEAAARLAPADRSRTTRALEIVRATGHTQRHWQARKTGGIGEEIELHPLILLPEREWLFARCDRRFAEMLERGAQHEVAALLERDLDPALPVMRAIGVPEIAALIKGDLTREEAIAAGQTATRQYAKRQYTWFRNQPPPHWPRQDSADCPARSIFVSLFQSTR